LVILLLQKLGYGVCPTLSKTAFEFRNLFSAWKYNFPFTRQWTLRKKMFVEDQKIIPPIKMQFKSIKDDFHFKSENVQMNQLPPKVKMLKYTDFNYINIHDLIGIN
jgi:hypothetical protein